MLLWVMPGFDLGGSAAEHRAAYIASSSWAWRLGWVPWQLCALSDLWVSVAVVCWVATRPARDGLRWAWFGLLTGLVVVLFVTSGCVAWRVASQPGTYPLAEWITPINGAAGQLRAPLDSG